MAILQTLERPYATYRAQPWIDGWKRGESQVLPMRVEGQLWGLMVCEIREAPNGPVLHVGGAKARPGRQSRHIQAAAESFARHLGCVAIEFASPRRAMGRNFKGLEPVAQTWVRRLDDVNEQEQERADNAHVHQRG